MTNIRVAPTVALCVVTLVTAASFARVFGDWSFLTPLVITAVVGHAISAIGRWRQWRTAIAVPVAVATTFVAIAWIELRDTLWWVGLPTRRTVTAAATRLGDTWQQVGLAVPPLEPSSPVMFTALCAVALVAVGSDAIAFRSRARVEALGPSGLVAVAIAAVGYDRSRVLMTAAWFGAALVYVAVSRADDERRAGAWVGRRRSWASAGVVIAVMIAPLAGVVAPRLPGAGAEPLLEPRVGENTSTGTTISPMVDIRGRLSRRTDAVLFTVRADGPAYWRLTAMSDFDGSTWRLSTDELREAGGDLPGERPYGEPLRQRITIERLQGNLVPVAASPSALRSSAVDLFYAAESGTVVVADPGLGDGDTYEIVSSAPRPPSDVLARAAATGPNDAYLDLPAQWSADLTATARDLVADAVTPYAQAVALQRWFRSEFTYDLDTRLDGSLDAIEQFLVERRGYCEQFAGAYAALARSIGLPSRVAVGFTPGDLGADGAYRVRGRHAHAWPEVWFDGIGWIGFEPTPGRGEPGAEAYTGVPPAQADPTERDASPTSTSPSAPPPSSPTGDNRDGAAVTGDGGGPAAASESNRGALVVIALLAAIVVWGTLMPVVVQRRRPSDGVVDDWHAIVTAMRLAGVSLDHALTPREAATAIARHSGLDRNELAELAHAATCALYDASPPSPTRRQLVIGAHLRESAHAVVPWNWRLLARLDPRIASALSGRREMTSLG
jgi:transglutaminase-like putative cysteine protease